MKSKLKKKAATGGGCFCFRFRLHASTAPKRSQEERKRRTESSRKRWIQSGKPGKRSNLKQSYDSAVALNFPQPTEFETETKTVNETETDFFQQKERKKNTYLYIKRSLHQEKVLKTSDFKPEIRQGDKRNFKNHIAIRNQHHSTLGIRPLILHKFVQSVLNVSRINKNIIIKRFYFLACFLQT